MSSLLVKSIPRRIHATATYLSPCGILDVTRFVSGSFWAEEKRVIYDREISVSHRLMLSDISNSRRTNVSVERRRMNIRIYRRMRSTLKHPNPPLRRIQRSMAVVRRGIDVVEEIPHCPVVSMPSATGPRPKLTMPNRNPTKLLLRPMPMQHHIEPDQHPRQPRRLEVQYAQKAQPHIRIPPAPDVHQRRTKRGAEERRVGGGSEAEEGEDGVGHEVGEVGDAAGGFFEHARVALDEEDVEEEVEGERAEVDEGGEEAPVLSIRISGGGRCWILWAI